MPRGGARKGAGRKKTPKTIDRERRKVEREVEILTKEAARELVRERVCAALEPLLAAQVSNALGIKYLVVREKRTGKFSRVPKNAAEKLNPDEEIIEVWEKDPSVQAFTDLLNRAIDKPKEQPQEIDLTLKTDMAERLRRARARAHARNSAQS